jgi:hypothetical protein
LEVLDKYKGLPLSEPSETMEFLEVAQFAHVSKLNLKDSVSEHLELE